MGKFKRSSSLTGKIENIIADADGTFIDNETGEIIPVGEILNKIYGNNPFTLSSSYKADETIE